MQYISLLQNVWNSYPKAKESWEENFASQYQWENGIPKQFVFVKLNPDISEDDSTFIANGIRQFFRGRTDYLFTRKQLLNTVNSVKVVLALFVLIISVISMSVAFFLLMIAMSQNIN
mmetsp:Transcript_15624/g.19662  ORF Transcript_15624/g.19662 Transcript_15624/m.19662 type:complete len:117 (+) Transcript_15624:2055-2405(+)